MADAIAVLNAGSSSIKFSLFAEHEVGLALVTRGQVEGIYTEPHFTATEAGGHPAGEMRWAAGATLGHDGALAHVIEWLKAAHGGDYRLAAVGHRVVHGGGDYAAPVRLDAAIVAQLEKLVPLAPRLGDERRYGAGREPRLYGIGAAGQDDRHPCTQDDPRHVGVRQER